MKTVTFSKDVTGRYNMDPTVKELWIEALLSGIYKQSVGLLKSNKHSDSYCCLGILCLLHGKAQSPTIDFVKREDAWYYPKDVDTDNGTAILPSGWVEKWAGRIEAKDKAEGEADLMAHIEKEDGSTISTRCSTPFGLLASLNDTFHYTFEEIAHFIRTYL